jgi:anti-sigma regulatory factor (Ser/Thr protein kinase)
MGTVKMTFQVEPRFMVISNPGEVIAIRRIAKEMAHDIGFDERTREEISLVVSELASNIIKYTQRGMITLSPVCHEQCEGIMIEAEDDGDGFNQHTALKDGVSTSGTLGVGLGAVNRLMDEFDILQRENHTGTRIICKRWLHDNSNHGEHCPFEFGVFSRPKPNEFANGDTFIIKNIRNATLVGVIDGVGHGVLANQAANIARQYIERHAESSLLDIFRGVERACVATRGVVMALAVFNWKKRTFRYASVGNIEAKFFSREHEKPKFFVRRGILGKHAPAPVITENEWHSGDMLALHSDGISTHWHWDDFLPYVNSPAQVMTEEIFNVMEKNHDDATIIIVK